MLIVSQDKKRVTESLELRAQPYYENEQDNGYLIREVNSKDWLALYKTEARAIEVLQEIIEHYEAINTSPNTTTYFYEMPIE